MEILINVLELSVSKHGAETPLTLGHLLNIMKMAQRFEADKEELDHLNEQEAYNNAFNKPYGN